MVAALASESTIHRIKNETGYIETHIHSVHQSGFHARLAKIDFEKITSKDFLPRLPPKKKQKVMDVPFAMM